MTIETKKYKLIIDKDTSGITFGYDLRKGFESVTSGDGFISEEEILSELEYLYKALKSILKEEDRLVY